MALAKALHQCSGESSRVFKDFCYSTLQTWRWQRRVIGKAEYLEKGENPRFIVTSFNKYQYEAQDLYEKMYCVRGDMENRIKEQQLMLFAARTSTSKMRSNQIRLYFSSIDYTVLQAFRRLCLAETEMTRAQCDTIRLKMLKIGTRIRITVRKVWIMQATGYPYKDLWGQILARLACLPLRV
ncbi:transposase [Desulfogranum marinum]|uniref:transposase n=1 Tax=Desulfogranum marinum TaxID=453220 RepID=UPI0029C6029D|nr:transposase [Desulfogranum marinum]